MIKSRSGFSLIELLMVVVISAVAMFGLAVPLVADRSFANRGKRKTEAQRDAQMAMRAIARHAHQSRAYGVVSAGPADGRISFSEASGTGVCFVGGPANGSRLLMLVSVIPTYNCSDAPLTRVELIDGKRSKVISFAVTQVVPNKIVRIQLHVTHKLRLNLSDTLTEDELLETELFLRNGT